MRATKLRQFSAPFRPLSHSGGNGENVCGAMASLSQRTERDEAHMTKLYTQDCPRALCVLGRTEWRREWGRMFSPRAEASLVGPRRAPASQKDHTTPPDKRVARVGPPDMF